MCLQVFTHEKIASWSIQGFDSVLEKEGSDFRALAPRCYVSHYIENEREKRMKDNQRQSGVFHSLDEQMSCQLYSGKPGGC